LSLSRYANAIILPEMFCEGKNVPSLLLAGAQPWTMFRELTMLPTPCGLGRGDVSFWVPRPSGPPILMRGLCHHTQHSVVS